MKFFLKKIKYLFDSALEKSLLNLFIFLILTSLAIILIFSATTFVIYKLGITIQIGETYKEFLWQTFKYFLSSGTLLSTGAINPLDFILKIIITIIGIGLFYTLIGIITQRVSARAHQLREGASEVQEKNHIVISGYTKKTTPLIKELVEALSEDKKLNILIISILKPGDVLNKISSQFKLKKNVNIVCRQGYIWQEDILKLANIQNCRSIFILNPDNDDFYKSELDSDVEVTKSFSKIVQSEYWKSNPVKIILEVFDGSLADRFIENHRNLIIDSIASAKLNGIGGNYPVIVSTKKLREQLIGQAINNPGSVSIFESIFGFKGSEFYFIDNNDEKYEKYLSYFYEKKLSLINQLLENVTIIGVYQLFQNTKFNQNTFETEIEENSEKPQFLVNPHKDYILQKGFGLIVLAENKSLLLDEFKSISEQKILNINFKIDQSLDVKDPKKENLDIAIFSTSSDENKIKNIINSIYKLTSNISIANWHLYVPHTMNKEELNLKKIINPLKQFEENSLPLGLILMPIRQIDTFDGYKQKRVRYVNIFQITNKFENEELSEQLKDIEIGHYLIDIISSKRKTSLDLKEKYSWKEIVTDGGMLDLLHTDKRLHFQDEINLSDTYFIRYQKTQRGEVFVKKIVMKNKSSLVNNFNSRVKNINENIEKSLSQFNIYPTNYENLYGNLEDIAFQKNKFLDFDNIIVLNNEIDEGHYSNPVEDHDMINLFNFFTYLFTDPQKVIRKIEHEKGITIDQNFTKDRNNDAVSALFDELLSTPDEDLKGFTDNVSDPNKSEKDTIEYKNFMPENAPSYVTEINSYKSKLLLQDFKTQLALPFKGVDLIETNSLSSKVLASAFYDTKNHLLMEYLFEKINFIKLYDVYNKNLDIKNSDIKKFFSEKNETFIGYIDYEYSSFYKGGTRRIRNFYINPPSSDTAKLNRGDKIIVISNYHESSFQGQSDWEDLFSLL